MTPAESNLTAELAQVADGKAHRLPVVTPWQAIVTAHVVSALLHGILIFNAAVWPFHFPLDETKKKDVTKQADLQFARGMTAREVEVVLTLDPPADVADKPTPVQEQPVDEPEPEPKPVEPVQTAEAEPAKTEPFEKQPEPVKETETGSVAGSSPSATEALAGAPAEPDEPVSVAKQEVAPPVVPSPLPGPRVEPMPIVERDKPESIAVAPAEVKAVAGVKPSVSQSQEESITLATIEPQISFTPQTESPKVSQAKPEVKPSVKPSPVTPPQVAKASSAPSGVTNGVEGDDFEKPVYPEFSRRAGEEGYVLLEIEVFADGSVGFVRVIQSSGYARLEKAAIAAVRRSRLSPARVNGMPVREVVRQRFNFRLTDR